MQKKTTQTELTDIENSNVYTQSIPHSYGHMRPCPHSEIPPFFGVLCLPRPTVEYLILAVANGSDNLTAGHDFEYQSTGVPELGAMFSLDSEIGYSVAACP